MSALKRKMITIMIVVIAIIALPCMLDPEILPSLTAMIVGFAILLPVWATPIVVVLLIGILWWMTSWARPVMRAGICLLASGFIIGLGFLVWGIVQTGFIQAISNVMGPMETGTGYHPDPEELTAVCSILPWGDVPRGVTVILSNTTTEPRRYIVYLGSLRADFGYKSDQSVDVNLTPGETRRLSHPPGLWMLGLPVVAFADRGWYSLTVASCSMLWDSRRWLAVMGALLALAGLLCLGAGWYRGRAGPVQER